MRVLPVVIGGALGVLCGEVGPARVEAQAPAPAAVRPAIPLQTRYHISVMESVLERAVRHGAQVLRQQMHAIMPDMLLLAGDAQARGFRLDGYGVFFDVEVPALRRSVAWTFRMLEQKDANLERALQSLRRHVQSLGDRRSRQDLEQALSRVELRIGPVATPTAGADSRGVTPAERPTEGEAQQADQREEETPAPASLPPIDPNEAYTAEVKRALIDAMLDHSGPVGLGSDEWLTVAARDNNDGGRLAPGDRYETVTVILRIRGSDLAAFRADRITRDEARKRVEVREF